MGKPPRTVRFAESNTDSNQIDEVGTDTVQAVRRTGKAGRSSLKNAGGDRMSGQNVPKMTSNFRNSENSPPGITSAKVHTTSSSPSGELTPARKRLQDVPNLRPSTLVTKISNSKDTHPQTDNISPRKRPRWYDANYISKVKPTPREETEEYRRAHPVTEFHIRHNRPKVPWQLIEVDLPDKQATQRSINEKWEEVVDSPRQSLPPNIDIATIWGLQPKDANESREQREYQLDSLYDGSLPTRDDLLLKGLEISGTALRMRRESGVLDNETKGDNPTTKIEEKVITRPQRAAGSDYSFMTRAAEETYNDSELVKGMGYVPKNRVHEVEESIEDQPWALPEDSSALETFGGKVTRYISRKVKKTEIDNLTFLWDGGASRLRIFSADTPLASIKLENIWHCNYSKKEEGEHFAITPLDSALEFLISTNLDLKDWSRLKRCFYLVAAVRPGRQKFNSPPEADFWPQKISALEKYHKKSAGPSLAIRRAGSSIKGPNPSTKTTPLFTVNPKVSRLPEFSEESGDELELDIQTPQKTSSPGKDPSISKSNKPSKTGTPMKRLKAGTTENPNALSAQTGVAPAGLYYKTTKMPVHHNDLVVRLRTKEDMEKGKANKFDVFDGPWRIKRFNVASQTFSISKEELNDKDKVQKMLSTKVELKFPKSSQVKTKWIELRRLVPVLDSDGVNRLNIRSSSTLMSGMREFQKLIGGRTGEDAEEEATETGSQVSEEGIGLIRLKTDVYVAVVETASTGLHGSNDYEVEKIRAKRLRRLGVNDNIVKENRLETEWDDPWVSRYAKNCRERVTPDKIIVTQFLIHWSGWPSEDDTWEYTKISNPPPGYIDEYNKITDPLRGFPLDQQLTDWEMLFEEADQLPPPDSKKRRKRPRAGSSAKKPRMTGVRRATTESVGEDDSDGSTSKDKLDLRAVLRTELDDDSIFVDEDAS